jgi:hydrogenase-4 component E
MTAVANFLTFLALVVTLVLVWRQSWRGRVRLFVVQSVLLGALAAAIGLAARRPALLVVAAVFLLVKTWLIPGVLRRMAAGAPLRPVTPGRSVGIPLLVAGGLVVLAYVIMLPVSLLPVSGGAGAGLPTRGAIPLAFAMALVGLYVCVTGRDALGQVTGFLVFENAIFGLGVVATYGLPGIVEAGVFLEVLVVVLLMEGVVVQMRREHDSLDVDRLRELRG